jgi:hypothetical protein
MADLKHNLRKAHEAVTYLQSRSIVSNNQWWRPWNFHKFTDYGSYLYKACRQDVGSLGAEGQIHWRKLVTIMNDPQLGYWERREKLKEHVESWKIPHQGKDYVALAYGAETGGGPEDENRIRSVRRSLKTHFGNCGEKGYIVGTWLLENRPAGETVYCCTTSHVVEEYDKKKKANKQVEKGYDHCFVIYGDVGNGWDKSSIGTLSDEAVIADGWTGDWYQAKHPYQTWIGNGITPMSSPVRYHVRRMIHNAPRIYVLEECHNHWPPVFSPDFRLHNADKPSDAYRQERDYESVAADELIPEYEEQLYQWLAGEGDYDGAAYLVSKRLGKEPEEVLGPRPVT